MALNDEIIAIESFVKAQFPDATTGKQTIPAVPKANSFYVRFLSEERENETRYHYRIDREYQIVYFAQWPEQVMPKMDALGRALYQADSIDYIRIESFSFSQPVKTDNDLFVSIGILATSTRESRDQTAYPKINNVTVKQP
ncbi:hypothetical protein PASE110613_09110 [Paenibacillus sediminis]|uniref:Uncharacterized protein n=1 Tax=Paenibacillus sediminis TaxID=664909 RepID=A0ABS4H6M3_9BACL|nr:hypothetical protein [Paenibacillus sediminis]MBP1938195.1 hypothetical protein [Paenibacillus sediminis]